MNVHALALYRCLQARPRPEDVAEVVLDAIGDQLTPAQRAVVDLAARFSLRRRTHAFSSMAADFARPTTGVHRQVRVAAQLFTGRGPLTAALSAEDCLDADKVEAFVRAIAVQVWKPYGETFNHRLCKPERRARGCFKNARWYNKRWRLLMAMERKISQLVRNQRVYSATRVGTSGLATTLTVQQVAADLPAACVVAYVAARMGLRSAFTNTSQVRAYDQVAEVLMEHCEACPTTDWLMIAHVLPDQRVLRHLTAEQQGHLLGRWWDQLVDMADLLEQTYNQNRFDITSMIVARGNDSTTWNQVAQGWNRAREQWLHLLHSLKLTYLLDALCPGKVMRLMAADVAAWHRASGGETHPDTKVWATVPLPWRVVRGEVACGRALVERACHLAGVSSQSWTSVPDNRIAVPFTPTPELVHGVAVSSPALAAALRRAGVFSGKPATGVAPPFTVVRDEHGAALSAVEAAGGDAADADDPDRWDPSDFGID